MAKFTIAIAPSLKYGHAKRWLKTATELVDLLKSNLDVINSMLDLPDVVKIKVRPIKGRTLGLWCNMSKTLSVDPRRTNMDTIVETVFHELVHAEQYKQGRLQRKLNDQERRYEDYWNGTPVKRPSSSLTKKGYQRYRDLPWEKEAFEREKILTLQFIREIIR